MDKRILVVDDEPLIVKGLKYSLEQDGYQIDTAFDGNEALGLFDKDRHSLVILDLMLPGVDGMEVCRRIREQSMVPIIMLTAKGEDMDKIMGLEHGADDYVTKPFNILELKARIKSIQRRMGAHSRHETLAFGQMLINLSSRSVSIGGKEVSLTAKEFDLLALFATNPGKVFSRQNLLETVWQYDYLGDLRTVDVHIRRLREKIETNPGAPEYIFTKWGVGYYFADR